MKIALVTDEISADPETAIELASSWGVHDLELRGIGNHRVPNLTPYETQRLRELLSEYHSRVIAVSPGLFKIPYPGEKRESFPLQVIDAGLFERWAQARDLVRVHMEELLPRSLEFCNAFGAQVLVAFSFERDAGAAKGFPEPVIAALREAATQCQAKNVTLALEVETGYWADTGKHTRELLNAVDHPALAVNWDPGNAIVSGEVPFPDGYRAVAGAVRHVHFKDVSRSGDVYNYVVQGEIDWPGQIEALAHDGYDGYISIETHMQPKVTSARAETERLKELIRSAA